MLKKFGAIYSRIIGTTPDDKGYGGVAITAQFDPERTGDNDIARSLNAAFMVALCGNSHPQHERAEGFLNQLCRHPDWGTLARFYCDGLKQIRQGLEALLNRDEDFRDTLEMTYRYVLQHKSTEVNAETRRNLWSLFFPEGVFSEENRDEKVRKLREKRKISITAPNPSPIRNPVGELLFTSNVLLTLPSNKADVDKLPYSADVLEKLKSALTEKQVYWYDHPIPIGEKTEHNQAIHGLRGLNDMMTFEKARGTAAPDAKLICLLSVSVTHTGLHAVARKCLEEDLAKIEPLPHLEVYLFTEVETRRLIDEVLFQAAQHYLHTHEIGLLMDVIGVDGEYGRHYSFLKAIAAFWKVFVNKELKGTFKIDLDQVFPENELVKETGESALEHFMSPLWGARGKDNNGDEVELGLIAGALVRQEDIQQSIYTPNIKYPPEMKGNEGVFFYSKLPMALSNEAEIATHYPLPGIDGKSACLQRAHVIGGMNGILIDSLRKFRPFTPTFIGRAEDQAYILSVLFRQIRADLRYAHKSGLIMRQDIRAISEEALRAGEIGRQVGDLVRILTFTSYARALPWPLRDTKAYLEPFTGCFVSRMPMTVVYSRLAMLVALSFARGDTQRARETQLQGMVRLHPPVKQLAVLENPLAERLDKERKAWDLYYDILDAVEENLKSQDYFALKLARRAENLVQECRVHIGR